MEKKTNIPGRIAAKDLPSVKSWRLPKVGGAHVVRSPFSEKENGDTHRPAAEELVDPQPLTVEAIEKIRQQAYDEAFKKGHQEGWAEGEQEGRAEGEKRGYEAGFKQGEAEINRLSSQLKGLIAALENPIQGQQQELEAALLQLVTDTSRAVVKQELSLRPELLRQAVQEALEALPHGEVQLAFSVHPQDVAQLEAIREREHANWSIHGDESLTPGGLKVKGAHSYLDYTLEDRFSQVVSQLLTSPESESSGEE